MATNESPISPAQPRRRASSAMIALWVFVVLEAIGLSLAIRYMLGGIGSR